MRLRVPNGGFFIALLDHPSLTGRGTTFSPTGHELHVAQTFVLSYERLDAADPVDALALKLLSRAAFFAPGEVISRELLLGSVELPDDELAAEDALARLVSLGLLEDDVLLHRLLAKFARSVADEEAQGAVERVVCNKANSLNKAGYPLPLLAWQLHLRYVTDVAQVRKDERGAGLCNELGGHLGMIGDYPGARPYYERALEICKRVLGPDHPDTAGSLNNLGLLLHAKGHLTEARLYYERALAICKARLGVNHPYTKIVCRNLAALG